MLRRLGSYAPPAAAAGASIDELALLSSLGDPDVIVPSSWLTHGESITEAELAETLGPHPGLVLVRTPASSESPFASLVLAQPSSDAQLVREVSSSCAEACYGVSTSRFASHLTPDAGPDAVDATLVRLSSVAGAALLPPPSLARVRAVVELALARSRGGVVLIQSLRDSLEGRSVAESARFGSLLSRDPRTGNGPPRARLSSSPHALLEAKHPEAPLTELALPAPERERLARALRQFEAAAQRPVRVSLAVDAERARIVAIQLLRRSGAAAFAIAHDLVAAGALGAPEALQLVQPADVAAAVPMLIEVAEGAVVATGIAAGSGIGEGFVCVEPAAALHLHEAGLPAILFVHDVSPEDIPALRVSAGVVAVRGGLTGEAAVIARGYSRPCVASGAALSLAGGLVREAGGGVLRPGERITIDGATGLIARGAVTLAIGAASPHVAAVIGWLGERPELGVTAMVDCAEHVLTAHRLGAREVVVARPELVLFEALHADGELEAALLARARSIAAAVLGRFPRLHVMELKIGWELPPPVARPVLARERVALQRAWQQCVSELALELVHGAPRDEGEASTWAPAAGVLVARIERGRTSLPRA